jgi:peptidyl-tRNA hydrolase, PTH1 family
VAWLVAGLGNPGARYANSRHNLGRIVVDELAASAAERFRKVRFMPSEMAEVREGDEQVFLVRSTLFMNESGPSFAGMARKLKIPPDHVIAVHDEIEISPGELRIKFGGGTAGHNGLRSLAGALRTPDFYRVRAGVGRPPGRRDPSDYVLAPIAKRDEAEIAILVDRAAEAARSLIRDGLTATQDRFNRSADPS